MDKIRNFTGRDIVLLIDGTQHVLQAEGQARAAVYTTSRFAIDADIGTVPITDRGTGERVTGLPPEQEGVWIVVHPMVATARPDREDLLCLGERLQGIDGAIRYTCLSTPVVCDAD